MFEWLSGQPGINIILNRTTPYREGKCTSRRQRRLAKEDSGLQMKTGSYANAVGLELASKVIATRTRYMFVMHNDILVCRSGWLIFLLSKLNYRVRGATVSYDPSRIHAMHASGFLFDFSLFKKLKMNFMPNIPEYDVGDLVTIRLREAGYDYYICKNTFNHPESVDLIDIHNPLHDMYCDRVFDNDGKVIYLHLGRGTPKAAKAYDKSGKTYPEQWVNYADKYLLS
jgi:hypothetical protein